MFFNLTNNTIFDIVLSVEKNVCGGKVKMDEKFIQKYFDEFRKFSLMLEEKEKKVFAMSNVDYDVDRGIYDAI